MNRLTIQLPDELAARVIAESERKQVPPSQIVEEAVENALSAEETSFPNGQSLYDRMKEAGAIGCIGTGIGDLSMNRRHMAGGRDLEL